MQDNRLQQVASLGKLLDYSFPVNKVLFLKQVKISKILGLLDKNQSTLEYTKGMSSNIEEDKRILPISLSIFVYTV